MVHPSPLPTKTNKFKRDTFNKITPRLLSLVIKEKVLLFWGTLALLGGAALNLTFPFIIRTRLNAGTSLEILSQNLTKLTLLLLSLFILQGICFYFRHYFLQLLGLSIVKNLKQTLYSSLLVQDISFFESHKLGDLLSRISTDTEAIQKGLSVNVSVIIRYLIQVIGGIALMLYLSIYLTALILLLIPILSVFSIFWSKKLKTLSRSLQESLGGLNSSAEEALTGIRVVKIHAAEQTEEQKYLAHNESSFKTGKDRTHVAALFSSSMVTLLHCSIVLIMWIGAQEVLRSKLQAGDLTAFVLYCTIVAVSFGFLINAWAEFVSAIGAAERVYEIIDTKPKIVGLTQNAKSLDLSTPPEIVFKDVNFSYPARPNKNALSDINITISAGSKIALVGPSGSGKSTLASLIPRLYDPTSGTVLVNNTDLKEYSLESLRSSMAYVPQQAQLFSGTLLENITYGLKEVPLEKVNEAVEFSALKETIERMPEGLNTTIGDKGIQLSGGEKQRVSIARAIIRNPKLIIFDEATSSLDSENENIIKEALSQISTGRTTLIIAHRLSTVRDADMVIVLKDGAIHQYGSHEDLVKLDGLYKNLVTFQLLEG